MGFKKRAGSKMKEMIISIGDSGIFKNIEVAKTEAKEMIKRGEMSPIGSIIVISPSINENAKKIYQLIVNHLEQNIGMSFRAYFVKKNTTKEILELTSLSEEVFIPREMVIKNCEEGEEVPAEKYRRFHYRGLMKNNNRLRKVNTGFESDYIFDCKKELSVKNKIILVGDPSIYDL